jgi:hypothetical protein
MSDGRVIPNLFIVGAPKCGTTALNTYLGHHPEIFMSASTESNHFATDLIPPDDPFSSEEKYRALFDEVDNQKIVGEKSVYYLLSKNAAGNIYSFNPEAKIIIMLRNPVDMLQSYHAQQVYNGDENILDFETALASEGKRKSGEMKIRKGLRIVQKLFYSHVVAFTEQVQRYLTRFPREQLHIILYDDFKNDTSGVYGATLRFLEVDPAYRPEFTVVNPRKMLVPHRGRGQKGWRGSLLRVIEHPISPVRYMINMTPQSVRDSLKKILFEVKPADRPSHQYPPMNPETRRQLQRQYRPEIEKLSILLGRDLHFWYSDETN